RSRKVLFSVRWDTSGALGAPRRVISMGDAFPLAVSSFQREKSRSNTIVLPSYAIEGQSTGPSLNCVTALASPPPTGFSQIFPAPDWSLMKYTRAPSALHIGQRLLKSPPCSFSYFGAPLSAASQISLSSRWLWPCRHHCPLVLPRAVKASQSPFGEGEEKNSV